MILNIDFHVHSERSADGRSTLEELVRAARAKGLHGFALTDHDLLSEPFEEDGFLIVPACECSTSDGHIIGLFLLELPTILKSQTGRLPTAREAVEEIHRLGGLAVWAHPYQRHSAIDEGTAALVDYIETVNARAAFKNTRANAQAEALADRLSKPMLGGSDGHHASEVGNGLTEVDCPSRTLEGLRNALDEGRVTPVLVRNTPRWKKGLSQLRKRRRSRVGPIGLCKAYAYICYCILLDLIKE